MWKIKPLSVLKSYAAYTSPHDVRIQSKFCFNEMEKYVPMFCTHCQAAVTTK